MTGPDRFRTDAPLPPPGRVVIEASAGTGKTYALAALATRLLAEGRVGVEQLLVVTFTRAAAAELRDRIRRRLVGAARYLADVEVGVAGADTDDDVHRVLLDGGSDEARARRLRLEQAVVDFDTATVTTIHGFCHQVLQTLGVTGSHDPDAVLVQDTGQVISGVCSDLLAERSLAAAPAPGLPKLSAWVRCVLNNPGIDVVALSGRDGDDAARELVVTAARRVRDRLVATGSISYDGLLEAVRDALADDDELAARLARQFPVALIDEFQDTDPVQWEIFRSIYATGGRGHDDDADEADRPDTQLILVGDPKQAIYAFRGGDIHTYLGAVDRAGTRLTLPTNWRSDGALVDAMNALCGGLELGDERIVYLPVDASPQHRDRRLLAGDGTPLPALDLRFVVGPSLERNPKGEVSAEAAVRVVLDDLAERVRALLEGGARVEGRPVTAGDVAVLVHAHRWSAPVQRALARHGIPSVIAGGSSVTDAPAAEQWRILADALVRPADATRVRALALSWFGGWPAEAVAATADEDPDALAELQARAESWATVLRDHGVSALVARVWRDAEVAGRLLGRPDGERDLTDLDHLGELLHAASAGRPLGPESLRALLDGLGGGDEEDPEAIQRRIPTDAAAVTIMTAHASKGLEFPVVCLPSLWWLQARVNQRVFHDGPGRRCLDVSVNGQLKAVKPSNDLARDEIRGQNDRLTYVALTRAAHHAVVWWVPSPTAPRTAVAEVLFGPGAGVPDEADTVDVVRARVRDLGVGSVVSVEEVDVDGVRARGRAVVPMSAAPTGPGDDVPALATAVLGRDIDRRSGRWSFTAVTARADDDEHAAVTDPVDGGLPDGVDPDDPTLGDAGDADEHRPPPPVLFDGLGAGAAFGTLVHEALEQVDFTADIERQLAAHLSARPWAAGGVEQVPALVTAIAASLRTPLGVAFDGIALSEVSTEDRLDELDFELPVGVRGRLRTTAVGELVTEALPAGDPVRPWAEQLAAGSIEVDLGGFLTGSIDLVLRTTGPHGPRFSVVDYKTNRLGPWGEPDHVVNYHPDRLPEAMAGHHYPLQALLYSVALHRYLRWRLPDYRPEVHLGPVGYLFVRGMVGPDTPSPDGRTHGVFAWTPPPGLIEELGRLLHEGSEP